MTYRHEAWIKKYTSFAGSLWQPFAFRPFFNACTSVHLYSPPPLSQSLSLSLNLLVSVIFICHSRHGPQTEIGRNERVTFSAFERDYCAKGKTV